MGFFSWWDSARAFFFAPFILAPVTGCDSPDVADAVLDGGKSELVLTFLQDQSINVEPFFGGITLFLVTDAQDVALCHSDYSREPRDANAP